MNRNAVERGYGVAPGAVAHGAPPPPPGPPPNGAAPYQHHGGEPYPRAMGTMMIQKGRPSNRVQKAITRQVNLATHLPPSTTEYLSGSESCITFDKRDHPPQVPRAGHCPLVLEAQIGGFDMSRVFMDGGSGINLIFTSTLRAMRIPLTCLEASDTMFHGIVPGKGVYPWAKSTSTSYSACQGTSGASASTLRSSTGPHNTIASLGASHSPGSWQYPTTPTCR